MSKRKIALLSGIGVVIIAIVVYLAVSYRTHKINNTITTSLTPEIITRLQKYPYYGGIPKLGFDQITKENPQLAKWISDTFVKYIVKFDSNEKFFTSEKLTYRSSDGHFVLRGVYQVKQKDGSYTEQDMEFEYKLGKDWGTKHIINYIGKRYLNQQRIIGG
jgi:hypothetical protein